VLILNIVRAVKQRPMYVTAISKVAGPIGTATPTAAFSLPFGVDAPRVFNFSPSARADAPNFDVAVLDTHNFMRGFLQPVSPATVKHYLDQGWPAHFVLSLFIREIRRPDGTSIVNAPMRRAQFEAFSSDLKKLVYDCRLRVVSRPLKIGPPLEAAAVKSDLGTLLAMQNNGVELRELPTKQYQLQKPHGLSLFTVDPACNMKLAVSGEDGKTNGRVMEHVIVLRSPEGVLYYLGELARAGMRGPRDVDGQPYHPSAWFGANRTEPMFVLRTGRPGNAEPSVKVEHEGETYYVPGGAEAGRSMHALSLVAQLIGLHKNAAEMPTTMSVRVINP
jgi:hypothetical protein